MPDALDLRNPHDALDAAAETRARVRSLPVHDVTRRQALQGSLDALKMSWTPAHETYCRRGPQKAKRAYDESDPVRVLGRERRAEMKRLRGMLNPTSGTPRTRPAANSKRSTDRALVPFITEPQRMWAHVGHVTGELQEVAAAFEPMPRAAGSDAYTRLEMREELQELLDRLGTARRRLGTEWRRYAPDPKLDPYEDQTEALGDRIELLLLNFTSLADEIRTFMRSAPKPRPEDPTWTRDRILRALGRWQHHHGRLPTARQCNAEPELPPYTLVSRKLGPSPLAEARRLLGSESARA